MNSFFFSIYLFYFIFVYFSNFRGSKNRESMDPVHESGPWTRSTEGVNVTERDIPGPTEQVQIV